MLRHRPSVALVFLNPRHRNGGDAHDTPPNTSFANPIVRSIDNFSLIVRILLSRKYVCRHLMFVPPVPSGRFAMPDETSALTTISSVLGGLSAFGSLLVVLSYILFVECRSLSRQLVSILALCDLGQGLFFIISPFVGNGIVQRKRYSGFGLLPPRFCGPLPSHILFTVRLSFRRPSRCVRHVSELQTVRCSEVVEYPEQNFGFMLKYFHAISWGYPTCFIIVLGVFARDRLTKTPDLPCPLHTPAQSAVLLPAGF